MAKLLLCFLITFGGGIRIIVDSLNFEDELCRDSSRHCVTPAYRILKYMDQSVDPCEDFYKFSCGKFLKDATIPSEKSRLSAFDPVHEEILSRGKSILEEGPFDSDFSTDNFARAFYRSCMNSEEREKLGVKPLQDKLKSFGGWPVLDGKGWKPVNYWSQLLKMNSDGFPSSSLVTIGVAEDIKKKSKVLSMDQASLGLSREYLVNGLKEKEVKSYLDFMIDTAVLLGAERSFAEADLLESLKFEIELAKITKPKELRRNATARYNPTLVGALKHLPGLPQSWTSHIQSLVNVPNLIVRPKERIILNDLEYLGKLSKLLEHSSPRAISNYIGWRAAKTTLDVLNSAARLVKHKFDKAITGASSEIQLWKRCVKAVGFGSYSSSGLAFIAGSMYVRRFFKPEAKRSMVEMSGYIRKAFEEDILEKLEWMDATTKSRAIEKLIKMTQSIGYNDELLNEETMETIHKGIVLSENDYFKNVFYLIKFWRRLQFKKMSAANKIPAWMENKFVAVANAFYHPSKNHMEFPAGILQGMFFNLKAPKYLNFGAIGTVIGHEITHGFDDQGRQRNAKGELENWWNPVTEEKYKGRAKCIIDQYSSFIHPQVNISVNGINTQGENIADNGGIREAYLGYLRWISDFGEEDKLEGLPYTPMQLFFISFAQVWCSKYRDGAMKQLILTDSHAPGYFRVLGTLSNNENFAKAFNCPVNSAMNPAKKCSVW